MTGFIDPSDRDAVTSSLGAKQMQGGQFDGAYYVDPAEIACQVVMFRDPARGAAVLGSDAMSPAAVVAALRDLADQIEAKL